MKRPALGSTVFILFAIAADASLYTVFKRQIGLQLVNNCLDLLPYGI